MKIERILSCFDKTTEKLLWERNINDVPLESLKKIFKPENDDELIMVYSINKKNVSHIRKILNFEFDLKNSTYEIGCFKVSDK